MSYKVLARKWRPQNFKEMVGQEHVLRALTNALDSDRLHHAYLFTGTRGVGKTTIARILAKSFNCETGVTSSPCGNCSSCQEITTGSCIDLIEVDAASRTKVEDTRELLENVQYAPTRARFKVYLIDEVHMLTGHSFNALLKTLEEPPPHVKFLFATTDPQKLPATILSRCLQFNLKRMPVDMITEHLTFLLKEESIASEPSALRLIGRAADGSMRDALSLLDQAIAFSGDNVTDAAVRDMLGTISHEPLIDLLQAIIADEGEVLLQQVEEIASINTDFYAISDALIALLHQVAVLQAVPSRHADEEDSASELAQTLSKEDVQLFYQIALKGRQDLAYSPDPRSGFEMLLLRMMSFRPLREGMVLEKSSNSNITDNTITKKKTIASPERVDNSHDSIRTDQPKNTQETQTTEQHEQTSVSSIHSPDTTTPRTLDEFLKQSNDENTQVVNAVPEAQTKQQNAVPAVNTMPPMVEEVPPWEEMPSYLNTPSEVIASVRSIDADDSTVMDARANSVDSNINTTANKLKAVASQKTATGVMGDKLSEPESGLNNPVSDTNEYNKSHSDNINPAPLNPQQPWHIIAPQLKLSGRANELIKHCLLTSIDEKKVSLTLTKDREDLYADTTKEEILSALKAYYGDNIGLELTVMDAESGDNIHAVQETPAQRSERKTIEIQQQAVQNIEKDPFVVALKNRFGAQIVPGSIKVKQTLN